ncbi:carbohydrate-binding module family 14 protein [Chitinophaga solisilvae]|uniref:Uncharacterized protein n=1 Tax=Chitinophaga solisilvae TaxID=1233460 RepID=A0A3S1CTJ2_9BACT|nr:hypothetical protein [Chitinophaga solisilvae]
MKKLIFVGALLCASVAGICQPFWNCTNPGQLLPDGWDCRVYYECDQALNPVKHYCSAGLYWNCVEQTCDVREKVNSACPCTMVRF